MTIKLPGSTSTDHEEIIISFELISFFIMFRHQELTSQSSFFTSQFVFIMPYLINFLFERSEARKIQNKLNNYYKLSYYINSLFSLILFIIAPLGAFNVITLSGHTLKSGELILLGTKINLSLTWVFIIELLSLLNIIIFNYKIKNEREGTY